MASLLYNTFLTVIHKHTQYIGSNHRLWDTRGAYTYSTVPRCLSLSKCPDLRPTTGFGSVRKACTGSLPQPSSGTISAGFSGILLEISCRILHICSWSSLIRFTTLCQRGVGIVKRGRTKWNKIRESGKNGLWKADMQWFPSYLCSAGYLTN